MYRLLVLFVVFNVVDPRPTFPFFPPPPRVHFPPPPRVHFPPPPRLILPPPPPLLLPPPPPLHLPPPPPLHLPPPPPPPHYLPPPPPIHLPPPPPLHSQPPPPVHLPAPPVQIPPSVSVVTSASVPPSVSVVTSASVPPPGSVPPSVSVPPPESVTQAVSISPPGSVLPPVSVPPPESVSQTVSISPPESDSTPVIVPPSPQISPPEGCATTELLPGNTFEEIANAVIKIDTAIKDFCSDNDRQVSEIYGSDNYILKYEMPEFKESDINVKLINRVIYTTARSGDGKISFKDIRILPDILKMGGASWVLEHKTLKVFFPFKTPMLTEVLKTCGDVDKSTINVPLMKNVPLELRMMP